MVQCLRSTGRCTGNYLVFDVEVGRWQLVLHHWKCRERSAHTASGGGGGDHHPHQSARRRMRSSAGSGSNNKHDDDKHDAPFNSYLCGELLNNPVSAYSHLLYSEARQKELVMDAIIDHGWRDAGPSLALFATETAAYVRKKGSNNKQEPLSTAAAVASSSSSSSASSACHHLPPGRVLICRPVTLKEMGHHQNENNSGCIADVNIPKMNV
ncbi:hypothetical protein CEUSTIGMA_g3733.t1 [Chlamydomonas eustigma]|uniref:Uncharacterized protein n=1 Tax=Chlamydomonas eustigma TaxID=1157962 RepID=A0A250WZM5_9CHLO|nr:hypothetical protein CEUSTIGMA_g3733.t1 [Chlamydomonas eustigma]|eukprot:GAX76288.1 hypothetical protein CEUSTIGMA_g3733.t1 [Chlamydomonas eustigma]